MVKRTWTSLSNTRAMGGTNHKLNTKTPNETHNFMHTRPTTLLATLKVYEESWYINTLKERIGNMGFGTFRNNQNTIVFPIN